MGSVIPSATVTIQNEETHVVVTVKTTNSGNYAVPFLPSGPYQVTVAHQGFQTFQSNHVNIELDQTVRLDARLAIGRVSQIVSVTANQALLATDSSELELTFSNALIQNLPIVGRNVTELAVLAPGTSTAQSQNVGNAVYNMDPGRVNVQGSRAFTINATLNGGTIVLPNSDNFQPMVPSLGAVSEFGVIQNNFSAQYGNGTSVLNIVTKSGTNQFHGTVFEFLENTALNATPGFSSSKAVLHYNQFGGAIGGPIFRNKMFFFFSYQNTLSPSSVNGIYTIPTTQMVGGNFSAFSTPIVNPSTGLPFPGNQIPLTSFDAVAAKVSKVLAGSGFTGRRALPQIIIFGCHRKTRRHQSTITKLTGPSLPPINYRSPLTTCLGQPNIPGTFPVQLVTTQRIVARRANMSMPIKFQKNGSLTLAPSMHFMQRFSASIIGISARLSTRTFQQVRFTERDKPVGLSPLSDDRRCKYQCRPGVERIRYSECLHVLGCIELGKRQSQSERWWPV